MSSSATDVQRSASGKGRRFRLAMPRKQTILLGLLLAVATLAVYYPVHTFAYLDYDDAKYVTENPHIHDGLDLDTVSWAFTHGYAANYHPLTWVSHALDMDMFALDPSGPHLENVMLHILDALLLFWVLLRATGYVGRSWMVAALFALHPINVESIAWVAERKTLLSTLFFLLALGAYRWYVSRPGVRRYLLVAFLFVLALLAKPQIITFPFVLLLWDYWPLRRMKFGAAPVAEDDQAESSYKEKNFSRLLKEKIPLFLICLVDAAVTMVAQGAALGPQPYSVSVRVQNALVAYVRYLGKAVWPAHLALMYPHPGNTLPWWGVLGALIFLATITVLVVRARDQRYLLIGWLWFLGTMVPMVGMVQVDVQAMADRYAYVSFIGLFIMLCWGVADIAQERHLPAMVLPAVSVVVLLALSAVTHRQINYWQDDLTVWRRSVQISPSRNWKGEYFLGAALMNRGATEDGIQHVFRAEEMFRGDPYINLTLANYEAQMENWPRAVEYYKLVAATSGNAQVRAQALAAEARAYGQLGDLEHARECLNSSTQTETARAKSVNWQGEWWKQLGPEMQAWWGKHFGSGK